MARGYYYGHAQAVIRNYPQHKKDLQELRSRSTTSDGIRSQNKISRPTETLALMQLPPAAQRELDAVEQAIDITRRLYNGEVRLKIIDYLFWKRRGNVVSAALEFNYSHDTIRLFRRDFIKTVAKIMGWID